MSAHLLPSESRDLIPNALESVPVVVSRKQKPLPKTVGFRLIPASSKSFRVTLTSSLA